MYGKPSSVDEARYQLFCTKGCSSEQLPPTTDELNLHLMRAAYQAAIWQHCLQPKSVQLIWTMVQMVMHGWKVEGSDISMVWMLYAATCS